MPSESTTSYHEDFLLGHAPKLRDPAVEALLGEVIGRELRRHVPFGGNPAAPERRAAESGEESDSDGHEAEGGADHDADLLPCVDRLLLLVRVPVPDHNAGEVAVSHGGGCRPGL